jgi:hypothetical protein
LKINVFGRIPVKIAVEKAQSVEWVVWRGWCGRQGR